MAPNQAKGSCKIPAVLFILEQYPKKALLKIRTFKQTWKKHGKQNMMKKSVPIAKQTTTMFCQKISQKLASFNIFNVICRRWWQFFFGKLHEIKENSKLCQLEFIFYCPIPSKNKADLWIVCMHFAATVVFLLTFCDFWPRNWFCYRDCCKRPRVLLPSLQPAGQTKP